jgi:hypothetical protein
LQFTQLRLDLDTMKGIGLVFDVWCRHGKDPTPNEEACNERCTSKHAFRGPSPTTDLAVASKLAERTRLARLPLIGVRELARPHNDVLPRSGSCESAVHRPSISSEKLDPASVAQLTFHNSIFAKSRDRHTLRSRIDDRIPRKHLALTGLCSTT